jgi:hypothetical protein
MLLPNGWRVAHQVHSASRIPLYAAPQAAGATLVYSSLNLQVPASNLKARGARNKDTPMIESAIDALSEKGFVTPAAVPEVRDVSTPVAGCTCTQWPIRSA